MKRKFTCLFCCSLMTVFSNCLPGQTVRAYDDSDWRNDVMDYLDKIQDWQDDFNIDDFLNDEED